MRIQNLVLKPKKKALTTMFDSIEKLKNNHKMFDFKNIVIFQA